MDIETRHPPEAPPGTWRFRFLDASVGLQLVLFMSQALLALMTLLSLPGLGKHSEQGQMMFVPVLLLGVPIGLVAAFVTFARHVFAKRLQAAAAPSWFTTCGVITALLPIATLIVGTFLMGLH